MIRNRHPYRNITKSHHRSHRRSRASRTMSLVHIYSDALPEHSPPTLTNSPTLAVDCQSNNAVWQQQGYQLSHEKQAPVTLHPSSLIREILIYRKNTYRHRHKHRYVFDCFLRTPSLPPSLTPSLPPSLSLQLQVHQDTSRLLADY